MRRAILPWLAAFGVALAAGALTVVALNATLFGAGGFVQVYLDAVARGDASAAMGLPGVELPADGVSDVLLDDDALAGLSDIRQLSVVEQDGVHVVTFAWNSPGGRGQSTFQVERVGTRFGLFPEWGFAAPPVATLSVKVLHDQRFSVNDLAARTDEASSAPQQYAVLVPGSYRVGHDTRFLEADSITLLVGEVEVPVEATVDVEPRPDFVDQVAAEVRASLDSCVTQTVLFPTGCPIGRSFSNRIVSTPAWSMVEYPEIVLQPGVEFGTWQSVRDTGVAHLVVDVQSLFDGSITTFDEDVPFPVSYLVTIVSENELLILAQL